MEKGTEFYNLISSILTFFATNKEPFAKEETLSVLSIRDAVLKAANGKYGERVAVADYSL